MIALQIKDVKPFMNKLLLSEYFDAFHISEATFITFSTFHIDGEFKKDYYSSEELEEQNMTSQEHITWKQIRPFCLELIKGKHTPLEFKIVFRLSPSNVEKMLKQTDSSFSSKDVSGLFLNIHFHAGILTCTTGTALRFFTLDKTLDHTWDHMIEKYLSIFVSTQSD